MDTGQSGLAQVSDNRVVVVDEAQRDGGVVNSAKSNADFFDGNAEYEPPNGIEFESHEAAYSFYQEYAKSMGFTTSIKNSRRSKRTKEFIDAKFACSRYGVTPESESGSSRRPTVKKTDCKASMHVKRRSDGKWIIHEFIKEHNHELLPALAYHFRIHRNIKLAEKNNIDILHAVSERTRKIYVEMSRQSSGYKNLDLLQKDRMTQTDKCQHLELDEGDGHFLLEYFKQIKKENLDFFYAIDLNEEQRLRNLLWVDAKSRNDYVSFKDAICFDTTYVKCNEKLPVAPFIGVNHHFQPMLLGCALVADNSKSTLVWVLKTWLRAMACQAPRVIITEQNKALKAAVEEVFPQTRHCFALWSIMEKIPEMLAHVIKRHENFLSKFNKCIFNSWTDDQFDMRWWKMVTRYELQDDEWIRELYEDRNKWVPSLIGDNFLAGMCTAQRSESVNFFFDKYIHKKMSLREFVKLYGTIMQNRYEEEAMADFDTWHKQPALRSPSPWEKQMSTIYTHAIFKKFQVEVLGTVGCHLKEVGENGMPATYRVEDCEISEYFLVTWNESNCEVSCSCRLFQYKGYLCRHALIVLQICGLSSIPPQYILKRWTKDARCAQLEAEGIGRTDMRAHRYNDLCKRAIEMSKEGSITGESYNIAFRAFMEALKTCVNVNNFNNVSEESSSNVLNLRQVEEDNHGSLTTRIAKKKNTVRKRKVQTEPDAIIVDAQESLQQMDNLSSGGVTLNGYYGSQQNVQGLVQLNLMEPPHDGYYVNQPSMQGIGQLNPLASSQEGFFGTQQNMHGLGQIDFRPPTSLNYCLQDDSHLRHTQLHGSSSRHS